MDDVREQIIELRANAETLRGIGMIDSANLMNEAADTMESLLKQIKLLEDEAKTVRDIIECTFGVPRIRAESSRFALDVLDSRLSRQAHHHAGELHFLTQRQRDVNVAANILLLAHIEGSENESDWVSLESALNAT